jgi:WD40 repeat protein/uncharacterized caspase-like protein
MVQVRRSHQYGYFSILILALLALLTWAPPLSAQQRVKIEAIPKLGHAGDVSSAVFSADGRYVISGCLDKTIKLWDAATGALIRTFEDSGSVRSVAFLPDGSRVLSGGSDKMIKLWDAATGALIRTLPGHSAAVTSVAFSPDGSRVLSGSSDKTIKLWDAATGALIRTLPGHSAAVTSVAFSPDGSRVLSGSSDKTIKLWDAATGAPIRTLPGHSAEVVSVAFSADGNRVLSGSNDKTIKLWDAATGAPIRTMQGQSAAVTSVAFSPDDSRVLSGGKFPAGNTIKLWDAGTGALIRTFQGQSQGFQSVAFSANGGGRVLAGGNDKTIKLWNAATGALIRPIEGHTGTVWSVAFSPDGSRVLSGSTDKTIKLWDAATGAPIRTLQGHSASVRSVAFLPDGSRVLSGSSDKTIKLWDAATGALIRTLQGHSAEVVSVAFSPDGSRVLSGSNDKTIKLWDTATGALIHTFEGHTGLVWDVAADGGRVLSGSNDKTIKLWDATTGALIRTFEGHSASVRSVAFLPDGSRVLSGSNDGTVRIWNSETGQLMASLLASQDGDWLAMTPEGFFATTRDGAEMLGLVRGLEVISAAQVFDHLYRPDLINEALRGDPEGKHKDEAFRLNLEKILDSGPAPQIEHMNDRAASAGDTYQLAVRITDVGGGIGDKVVWRVADQARAVSSVRIQPGAVTDKAVTVSASIPVDPGQDTLVEVTAYNGAGLLASLPYQIRIDKFGATTEERPRMFALVIGVSKYLMPDFELQLAAKDATAFGDALKKVGGGLFGADKVYVRTLLDEQVTKKGIEAAFDEIATRAKLGDVFVLYLSGHGKSVAGRYFYYPQTLDFARGHLVEQDTINQDAWQAWVARIAAQKKVLIIDTCESSAAAGLIRGTSTRRTAMHQLQHATGENLIAAARQAAFEGWQGHGVLTFALLEAMNKKEGDSGGDERIQIAGLASYVDERVPEISQQLTGLYQKPEYRLSGSDFPIGVRQSVLTENNSIASTPTHVIIANARVREQAAADAQGERELTPGTQVRVLKFVAGWALIAIGGQTLGYVQVEAVAILR